MTSHDAAFEERSSLRRYSLVRRPFDKYLFLVVFLVGAALITTLKMALGPEQALIIFVPLALMGFYWLLVGFVPRFRLREDQVGDNMYYLGFLYTLTSLAVALYYFADGTHAFDQIVTNFGIALATTIVGVAVRVVMHQMREDPLDTEREARESLAEASSRLRAELDDSVRSMSTFSRQLEQIIEETLHEISAKARETLSESSMQVSTASNQASEGIMEAFRRYNEQVGQLSATSKRQITAIETLTAKLDAVEIPSNLIEEKLSPPIQKLLTLVNQNLEMQKAEEARREDLAETIKLMGSSAREVKKHTVAVSDTLNGITSNAATLSLIVKRLEEVPEKVGGAAAASQDLAQAQVSLASAQSEALEKQRERLIGLQEEIEMAAQGIIKRIATEQEGLLEQLTAQARESLSEIQDLRKTTQLEARQAQEATQDVLRQLASMVRALGEELGSSSGAAAEAHGRKPEALTGADG